MVTETEMKILFSEFISDDLTDEQYSILEDHYLRTGNIERCVIVAALCSLLSVTQTDFLMELMEEFEKQMSRLHIKQLYRRLI